MGLPVIEHGQGWPCYEKKRSRAAVVVVRRFLRNRRAVALLLVPRRADAAYQRIAALRAEL